MADIETLLGFLREHRDRVKKLLRPPFGRVRELPTAVPAPDGPPNAEFRDPRIRRDAMQDMRMPPYMRDSDQTPLSLTRRQYDELMAVAEWAATHTVRPHGGAAPKPATPHTRRYAKVVEQARGASFLREAKGEQAKPPKIVPRNLTARAAIFGNPAITRPEDAVGNCYPGLEIDVRNLDRRF